MNKSSDFTYDYSKLRGRMAEFGYTNKAIASAVGITAATFSIKLNNRGEFSQGEIRKIADILKISCDEIGIYFFCKSS